MRILQPRDIPLPEEVNLELSPPVPPGVLLLLGKVFLSLFTGYFLSLFILIVLAIVAAMKGFRGTIEEYLWARKPLLHFIGNFSGLWILYRSIGLHFRRTSYFANIRGKELILDPSGFRICKSFATKNGRELERFRQADRQDPYFRLLWSDIGSWQIRRIGARAPKLVHRIVLKNGDVYELDRYCMMGAELIFLEYARGKVAPLIVIQDVRFLS